MGYIFESSYEHLSVIWEETDRKEQSMKTRIALVLLILVLGATTVQAKVLTKNISYQDDGVVLEGYLAYDDSVKGKAPGVLIVHEWWGLNGYARKRAEQLAAMGYVAFALDMYGKGKVTQHPKQAAEWMRQINSNVRLWRQRALAGLQVLKNEPKTDATRIAAIGL
jgi:dienelactone hydrolase